MSITTTSTENGQDISSFGIDHMREQPLPRQLSSGSFITDGYDASASGMATPDPLVSKLAASRANSTRPSMLGEDKDEVMELRNLDGLRNHTGGARENLSRAITDASTGAEGLQELRPTVSRNRRLTPRPSDGKRPSHRPGDLEEQVTPNGPRQSQGVPPELRNFTAEIIFVIICSAGQLLFAFFLGDIIVNLQFFKAALGLQQGELPWLVGAFLTALGLSVILSGSLTDILPPRMLIHNGGWIPCGFLLGGLQGGALSERLEWIFGSNATICGLCALAAYATIPALKPVADHASGNAPSIKNFDWKGAICATVGCVCLLFGLTQGSVVHWSPYTYALIIVAVLVLALFFWVETKVPRPLVPARLWTTPGFAPLMLAYFLGFGSFIGSWQFYTVQFFLTQQRVSPSTVALHFLPNAICGVLATWIVSKLMHRIPRHYIFLASQFAFALGPAFFLPQKPSTSYFKLSMTGIGLVTFGPDLCFAAASIYVTSQVPRSYQGSAGSLLVTVQNLSSAIMTSVTDSVAAKVDTQENGEIGLQGLRAAWWIALASALIHGQAEQSVMS
ncbi:Putative major facilitator superfamily, MFS transporter superfamily [Septoria linicola]|uniref:Major facilitator superfamily, MFS transporter superfamily n=1 Tax=Septoria linicola TaxID=215465 RepID=A0A9Q9AKT8_9PEZI|nr:putative major facilitator superfamily, MFS transporter superfamily [Septoria linicola]USW50870.1 Putative major facilitator superfamily, MFS transporter superfamily [Septoria linicola]